MAEVEYSIVCNGEILEGFDHDHVKKNLAALFKQPVEKVGQILERSRVIIKSGLDELRANQYKQALTKAGLKVMLEPSHPPAVAHAPAQTDAAHAAAGKQVKTPSGALVQAAGSVKAREEAFAESRMVQFNFNGQGGEYFRIWIVNFFLSILTFGIFSAWAKVRNKQYFYGNTELDGSTFEYTGNPVAILKGRAIAGGFFILYSGVGDLFPVLGLVMFVLLMIAMPWIIKRSLMFNARNTVYRNIRLHFHGSVKEAALVFGLWPLAGMLTLGILAPLAFYKQQRFLVENHSYGTAHFDFYAEPKDYYKMFGVMILAFVGGFAAGGILSGMVPPLGFLIIMATYLFVFVYFSVSVFNLRFTNSKLVDHGFQADMQHGSYAKLVVINTLLTVITLGLYRPWAMVRTVHYKAEHLALEAVGDLDNFIAQEEKQVSALGEEMGDMFDFDVGYD
jgi:uncharacterized membrane protein YjgN (DUF898 family)